MCSHCFISTVQNSDNSDDVAARGQGIWLSWEPQHSYVIGAK